MNPLAIAPEIAQAIAAALATNKVQELLDTTKVPAVMVDNYWQMRRMNEALLNHGLSADGTDDFYHKKVHKEIAERGIMPMLAGQTLGYIKESWDLPKNLVLRKLSRHQAAQDFAKDLTDNIKGVTYRNKDMSDEMTDDMKKLYEALRHENKPMGNRNSFDALRLDVF